MPADQAITSAALVAYIVGVLAWLLLRSPEPPAAH